MAKLTNTINGEIVANKIDYIINDIHVKGPAIDMAYKIEIMINSLTTKNKELSKKMEELRLNGNNKSYQYREYMGMKLTNSRVLTMLEEYEII